MRQNLWPNALAKLCGAAFIIPQLGLRRKPPQRVEAVFRHAAGVYLSILTGYRTHLSHRAVTWSANLANRELAKFAYQVTALCDKWNW